MKKRKFLWLKREEGQSIVEAALVIPLFLVVLCGIIDFGWIFSNQLSVNNCSREGARFAVVNSDEADLSALVTSRVLSVSGIDSTDLTVETQVVAGTEWTDVQVTVTKGVKVLTPIAGIFVPSQVVDVQSTSVMRIG